MLAMRAAPIILRDVLALIILKDVHGIARTKSSKP